MLTDEDALFLKKKIPQWRKDPVKFVKEVWKVQPTEQQISFLRAIAKKGAKVSVKSGHGTGKTTCFAWIIHWFLICYDRAKIPVTAPTSSQLQDALWEEIKLWWNMLPEQLHDLFDWTSDHFRNKDTESFAVARTASKSKPEALQGMHADNILFLIDEASGVYEDIFIAAGSSLSAENARVAMASNPTQIQGYFYESHNKNRALWTCLTFNGEESPRVSKAYVDEIANTYGKDSDQYRIRVLGEFPLSNALQFISRAIVDEATKRIIQKHQFDFAPAIITCDPAWEGTDEIVIYMRQGLYSKMLYRCLKNDNDVYIAGIIARFEDKYKADAVFIDLGYGTGIYSAGVTMGRNWQLVSFGGASNTAGYANKRAEMWGKMKDWLKNGGVIEDDEVLRNDLTGPQAYINLKGEIILEKKEDMKKRGLASPNRADALALSFAYPVVKASQLPAGRNRQADTSYNFW